MSNLNTEIGNYVNMPDTEDSKKVAGVIKEIDNALVMIQAKKDYIKEAKKALKEDYDLTPKSIQLMIKLFHAQGAEKHFDEQRDFEDLYDCLFNNGTSGGVVQ